MFICLKCGIVCFLEIECAFFFRSRVVLIKLFCKAFIKPADFYAHVSDFAVLSAFCNGAQKRHFHTAYGNFGRVCIAFHFLVRFVVCLYLLTKQFALCGGRVGKIFRKC